MKFLKVNVRVVHISWQNQFISSDGNVRVKSSGVVVYEWKLKGNYSYEKQGQDLRCSFSSILLFVFLWISLVNTTTYDFEHPDSSTCSDNNHKKTNEKKKDFFAKLWWQQFFPKYDHKDNNKIQFKLIAVPCPAFLFYYYFLITYGVCKKRKCCNRISEKKIHVLLVLEHKTSKKIASVRLSVWSSGCTSVYSGCEHNNFRRS